MNNTTFKFGAFCGAILLTKIQIAIIVLILIEGVFLNLEMISQVLAVIFGAIVFVGHIKTTVALMRDFSDPTAIDKIPEDPENVSELLSVNGNKNRYLKPSQIYSKT